jgi:pSer/pThr/pTyr-binding forkhead associated (FHA) protein
MASLCMLDNAGATAKQWPIGPAPIIVGRSGSVDAKVDDEGMSRRHFSITREGDEYVIRDLSSRNGTWVHGHRAVAARLSHNDCVLAGRTLFRFFDEREATSNPPQALSGPHGTEILCDPLDRAA